MRISVGINAFIYTNDKTNNAYYTNMQHDVTWDNDLYTNNYSLFGLDNIDTGCHSYKYNFRSGLRAAIFKLDISVHGARLSHKIGRAFWYWKSLKSPVTNDGTCCVWPKLQTSSFSHISKGRGVNCIQISDNYPLLSYSNVIEIPIPIDMVADTYTHYDNTGQPKDPTDMKERQGNWLYQFSGTPIKYTASQPPTAAALDAFWVYDSPDIRGGLPGVLSAKVILSIKKQLADAPHFKIQSPYLEILLSVVKEGVMADVVYRAIRAVGTMQLTKIPPAKMVLGMQHHIKSLTQEEHLDLGLRTLLEIQSYDISKKHKTSAPWVDFHDDSAEFFHSLPSYVLNRPDITDWVGPAVMENVAGKMIENI